MRGRTAEKTGCRGGPVRPREAVAGCSRPPLVGACMPATGTTGSRPVASSSHAPHPSKGGLASVRDGTWAELSTSARARPQLPTSLQTLSTGPAAPPVQLVWPHQRRGEARERRPSCPCRDGRLAACMSEPQCVSLGVSRFRGTGRDCISSPACSAAADFDESEGQAGRSRGCARSRPLAHRLRQRHDPPGWHA